MVDIQDKKKSKKKWCFLGNEKPLPGTHELQGWTFLCVCLLLLLLCFVAASSNIFPDYSTIDSCDSLIVSAVYTVVI